MTIRRCVQCRHHSLIHTGGFWQCGSCGYAITQTALASEQKGGRADARHVPNDAGQVTNANR